MYIVPTLSFFVIKYFMFVENSKLCVFFRLYCKMSKNLINLEPLRGYFPFRLKYIINIIYQILQ